MEKSIEKKREMFARAITFGNKHPSDDPRYAAVQGRLVARVTRIGGIVKRQLDGLAGERSAHARRGEIRKVVQSQLLPYLIAVGVVAASSKTELAERFRLPKAKASHPVFLATVKGLLGLAEANMDALVQEGMMPTLLTDLKGEVLEFEAASEAARAGRLDHMGARAELHELVAGGMVEVKILDGINRYRFGKDPFVLAEWRAAKRLMPGRAVPPPVDPQGQGSAA